MDETDRFVVFFLYPEDPTRPLSSYVGWLCALTGTIVVPTQGGLCKPNLVPYDKFRPCNTRRQSIASISSRESILSASSKFGDVKHLKSTASLDATPSQARFQWQLFHLTSRTGIP